MTEKTEYEKEMARKEALAGVRLARDAYRDAQVEARKIASAHANRAREKLAERIRAAEEAGVSRRKIHTIGLGTKDYGTLQKLLGEK